MRRLIVVGALLAMVSSASAIGVGISGHYNIGILVGQETGTIYKTSLIGFLTDVEIRVHPFINVVAAFGYQVFKPDVEDPGDAKFTIIPIQFGVEYPAEFGNFAFYPGGGMSYNMMKTTTASGESESENKIGAWFGGNFYYMFGTWIGFGPSLHYGVIFAEPENISWIHFDFGFKYWFM